MMTLEDLLGAMDNYAFGHPLTERVVARTIEDLRDLLMHIEEIITDLEEER